MDRQTKSTLDQTHGRAEMDRQMKSIVDQTEGEQ
jgi:hypothetical protein